MFKLKMAYAPVIFFVTLASSQGFAAEVCKKEKAILANYCKNKSCPKREKQLQDCLAEHGGNVQVDTGGQCKAEIKQFNYCKTIYTKETSCPKNRRAMEECLGTAPKEDIPDAPNGTASCNNNNALSCMICNCHFESRGESYEGRVAVGKVVMTRSRTKNYPSNACAVIHEKKPGATQYQFSWYKSSNNRKKVIKGDDYKRCYQASKDALDFEGMFAVHYHAKGVSPSWARNCKVLDRIGNHVFYRNCDNDDRDNPKSSTAR